MAIKAPPSQRPTKPLPEDVLRLLRQQLKKSTGVKVGAALGISSAAVSQAKNDKFKGNVEKLVLKVRGLYGGSVVTCPVLGEINTKLCLDQQAHPSSNTNPMRANLARSCKSCPHNRANHGGKSS